MDIVWTFVMFGYFWHRVQAATTTIQLLPPRATRNAEYLTPILNTNKANNAASQSKTLYNSKSTRGIDDFITRPQIKPTSPFSEIPSRYTSYAPSPSGIVAYKNLKLPITANASKIPIVMPDSQYGTPRQQEASYTGQSHMLMVEESPAAMLEAQHNGTIEAAKLLASNLLKSTGFEPLWESENKSAQVETNATTDFYIVKTEKNAYVLPPHIRNGTLKPTGSDDDLYSLRNQFERAFTINQFIFVIKPEKINFLNKLV